MNKKRKEPHEDPSLQHLAYAEHLRKNQTFFERWLWKKLKGSVRGSQVWRQTVVQGFIIDFYIPELYLAVELDGQQHDQRKDSLRDKQLLNKGITTLRFKNPTNQAAVNDIFSTIYAEVRHRQSSPFPQNPQDLSKHQRGFMGNFKSQGREENCSYKRGGNVEKEKTLNSISRLPESTCRKIVEDYAKRSGERGSCTRQVFASMEVAKTTARALEKLGLLATPERCKICGLIHIEELR